MKATKEYKGETIFIGQEWLCREGNSFIVTRLIDGVTLTPQSSSQARIVSCEQLLNAYVTVASGRKRNGVPRPKSGLEYKLFRYFKSMRVTGAGNATLSKLANSGLVTSISDLYLAPDMSELISEATGITKKSAESLATQLKACLQGDFLEVMAAISPKQISSCNFQSVIEEFGSMESALSINSSDFVRRILKAPYIGSTKAKDLSKLMQDAEFRGNFSTLKRCSELEQTAAKEP